MANKYIRHGETFNGNGTSPDAAIVDGGVGAWNSLNILDAFAAPNYGGGALAAGDVVYIRSKDQAGTDINRAVTANVAIGNAAATAANPIHWIVDNGTVWPGADGVITYANASVSGWVVTQAANNKLEARTRGGLAIKNTNTSPANHPMFYATGVCVGLCIDFSAKTNANQLNVQLGASTSLENCLFNLGRFVGSTIPVVCYPGALQINARLLNCDFVTFYNAPSTNPIMGAGNPSYPTMLEVIGGSLSGVGLSGQVVVGISGAVGTAVRGVGFQIPKVATVASSTASPFILCEMFGLDGGIGCHAEKAWGFVTTRSDTNHPVLSARLPDTAGSQWSYRIYPRAPTTTWPVAMPIAKLFEDAAAIKTLTLEYLLATGALVSNTENTWMTVEYTDNATGLQKHFTTQVNRTDAVATTTSTAGWSSTSWGVVSCVKRKLVLTTPTTIKQNTTVFVTFHTTMVSSTTDDILFLDPDFTLS